MKKILLFIIFATVVLACHKNCMHPDSTPPPGTKQITGSLHYDNFPDGWGLYYATDSNENLIFKNMDSNAGEQYQRYKSYVGMHTVLTYTDKGDTGCLYGIVPVCGIRVVEVVNMKYLLGLK